MIATMTQVVVIVLMGEGIEVVREAEAEAVRVVAVIKMPNKKMVMHLVQVLVQDL
jgi:predicted peroxiredoxin